MVQKSYSYLRINKKLFAAKKRYFSFFGGVNTGTLPMHQCMAIEDYTCKQGGLRVLERWHMMFEWNLTMNLGGVGRNKGI